MKRKPYKQYSREFKLEAIRLAEVGDKTASQVAPRARDPGEPALEVETAAGGRGAGRWTGQKKGGTHPFFLLFERVRGSGLAFCLPLARCDRFHCVGGTQKARPDPRLLTPCSNCEASLARLNYTYDGKRMRVKVASVLASTTSYPFHAANGNLLFEYDPPGVKDYVYLGNKLIAISPGSGAPTYMHTDLLGSPVVATDTTGALTARENYQPWGQQLLLGGAAGNTLWFTGKSHDWDSKLSYFGARYYDVTLGRFMGVDPQDFDETNLHSFNRYAYANNNPYKFVDPGGNSPLSVLLYYSGGGYAAGVVADAISQHAAFGQIDWSMAATSNAAAAGGVAGLLTGIFPAATLPKSLAQAERTTAIVLRLEQGNARYGLEHIIAKHSFGSTGNVSRFAKGMGSKEIEALIQEANQASGVWRTEGSRLVREVNLGKTIGTDQSGSATSWLRTVASSDRNVITAYPVPAP